jgi:N-acetylneuraminic acid mutarotase
LHTARWSHTATLLPNGEVLVSGGETLGPNGRISFASAELYDLATGTWTITGSMSQSRFDHTATLLQSGQVLVAGENTGVFVGLASAELYNPSTSTWTTTGSMTTVRRGHTMTLLQNGQVLVAGGQMARATSSPARNSIIPPPVPGS